MQRLYFSRQKNVQIPSSSSLRDLSRSVWSYMVINQDLGAPEGREAKGRTISPSTDPRVFRKSLTVCPPQQHTVHCPASNWRGMGEESSSLLMAVPSCCPKAGLPTTSSRPQQPAAEDEFPSTGGHMLVCASEATQGHVSPCRGKQRNPTKGLAPIHSNPPDFLGSGKLSSC